MFKHTYPIGFRKVLRGRPAAWAERLARFCLAGLIFLVAACGPLPETGVPAPATDAPLPGGVSDPATAMATSGPTAAPAEGQPTPAATSTGLPRLPDEPEPELYPDLSAGELPAGPAEFLLPLTIRHLGADRAVLFFELRQPAEGFLLYQQVAPERQATQAIPLTGGTTRHQLVLEGLAPGAEYLAVVGLRDAQGALTQPLLAGQAWGSLRFRALSGEAPLRVGVLGDASFGDPGTEALVQEMAGHDLDFVLHTGDVVAEIQDDDGPVDAYKKKFYQTLSPLLHRLPVYTVIGNHDYDAPARWEDSVFYYYAFPPFPDPQFEGINPQGKNQFYAFAYGDIQFLMLDTQVIFGVEGREAEQAWMAERLADPRFRYTIPVFHVPPFFSGSVHPNDQLPVRRSWHPLFAAAQVPLALSGHSHHYERLQAEGITYIVTGGGSSILYAPGEVLAESQVFARRTHFVLLEIHPDRIDLAAIDRDGEQIDQATIPLP